MAKKKEKEIEEDVTDEFDEDDEGDEDEEEVVKRPKGRPKKEVPKQLSVEEEKIALKQRLEQLELEETYNKFVKDAPNRIDDLEKAVHENRKLLIKLHETQKAQQEAMNVLMTTK